MLEAPSTTGLIDRYVAAKEEKVQADLSNKAGSDFDRAFTEAMIDDHKHVFWLDVQCPTEQELATLAEAFQLHPLALEDASHEHQRPKVEEYEHFVFLVFHRCDADIEYYSWHL